MNAEASMGARRRRRALGAVWAACATLLLAHCELSPEPSPRREHYVTVRLDDSLSRFDSVVVQILSGTDTAAVVGTLWSGGPLAQPGALPSYRLDGPAPGDVSIRVRAWDADGRLALDENLAQADGKPVVTAVAIPKPSPRLAALAISAGSLSPAFAPGKHAYSSSLPYSQGSIRVTASPEYAPARVYVGPRQTASGQPSDPVPLDPGSNRITVTVLAGDTSDQYVLDILRAAPPDTGHTVPGDTGKTDPGDTGKTDPGDTDKTAPGDTSKPGPRDTAFSAWSHKGMVTLRLPSAVAGTPSLAADFPLLLRLDASNFPFSEARDSGQDLRFMTPQGKVLDYTIARWEPSAQKGEVYIRCDTLAAAQESPVILMYWGNAKAAAASDPARVFPSSRGWTGVWHLEENGSGKSGEYRDAAATHHGTGGGGFPSRVEGAVGYAQDFDGRGSQGWITVPGEFDPGAERYTLQLWIYRDSRNAAYLLNKTGMGADDSRFEADLTQGSGVLAFGRRNGDRSMMSFGPPVSAWMLLGIACDGDSMHVYANGVLKESHPFALGGNPLSELLLGVRNPQGEAGFTGNLDEFWSWSGVRDAWYMRLAYENQKPGSTLATLSRL